MTALTINSLNVWFGAGQDRVDAVKEASFAVPKGASFGLVGESGSGKSTILRAITGLAPNWSGDILINETPVQHPRKRAFYKTVQMVFQDPYASLHPRHSVDQVLSETLHLHGFKDIDQRVNQLLEDVGLGPAFRFRYPHQLSGGQRQRVAIARALAPAPDILLLDEPTSALDVSVQAEILNLLSDLQSEHGLTFVMVSHDLSVVSHMCDSMAVMKNGEIVEILDVQDMRAMTPTHDYTRHLLNASLGYHRASDGAAAAAS